MEESTSVMIEVLGRVRISDPALDEELGGGQARVLLAYLVSRRGASATTSEVIDALWPEDPPASAATIVHGLVARLRRALGKDRIIRDEAGYALRASAEEVDLWKVDSLLVDGDDDAARQRWAEPAFGHYSSLPWARRAVESLTADLGVGAHLVVGAPRRRVTVGRLVGRRREVTLASEARSRSRLVTIVGLGGVGKTRLALEVVRDVQDRRVLHVDVGAAVGHSARRLLSELGLVSSGDAVVDMRSGAAYIGSDPTTLLLDGCEHDPAGAAQLVENLLASCPELEIVATSRRALGVPGEHVLPLLPFDDAADPRGDAVALLLDRVRAMGVTPGPEDRARASTICQRCAGVPLAIELAVSDLVFDADHAPDGGVMPEAAVANVVERALDDQSPATITAGRRAALLIAGFTPELMRHLNDGSATTTGILQELVTSGLVVAETAGSARRLRFLDRVRETLLRRSSAEDLTVVASALISHMGSVRPDLTAPPVIERLRAAVPELTNVDGVLLVLHQQGDDTRRLELAVAASSAWRDDGHWVTGAATIADAMASAPLAPPDLLAEAAYALVSVASTYADMRRLIPEVRTGIERALAAGRTDLEALLRFHLVNALGYGGEQRAALEQADLAWRAADATGSEYLRAAAACIGPAGDLLGGRPEKAHRGFAAAADRLSRLGALGDAARMYRLGSIALRSADDLRASLAMAERAAEVAQEAMARGTLTVIRTDIAELRYEIDPAGSEGALADALEASLTLGNLRAVGIVRMRRGALRRDTSELAQGARDLLHTDPAWAALALAELLELLPSNHPSRGLMRDAIATLSGSWGSPLSSRDQAIIAAASGDELSLPDGWDRHLEGALIELSNTKLVLTRS